MIQIIVFNQMLKELEKNAGYINRSFMKKLSTGKNKIRLNFLLSEDNDPINTFARLVWSQHPEE